MSDATVQGGTEDETYPRRKRAGKLVFLIGLLFVVSGITLSLIIGTAAAYSGSQVLVTTYTPYLFLMEIGGVLMALIGLVAWVLPYGMQGDGLWILKTGPFIK
jgi:hypothetical protein